MFNTELPVFIQPQDIVVVRSKSDTHRQLLTLINPFNFILHYKILSNAPSNFKVNEPSGYLKPKCVVDIVVRHLSPTSLGSEDCLRVEIFKEGQPQVYGRKDIKVHVVTNEIQKSPNSNEFRSFPGSTSSREARSSRTHSSFVENQTQTNGLFWFAMVACCASIITILLPTHDENPTKPSLIPSYLHPTQNLQLVAAYSLGIITVYLMRQNA